MAVIVTMGFVRRRTAFGSASASRGERRKTASQPIAIPLLMAMLIVALTIVITVVMVTVILVFEMVRGLRVSGIFAASWGKWGKTTSKPIAIPVFMLMAMLIVALTIVIAVVVVTVILVIEMVRGLRVSGIFAASWGKRGKTTSKPVAIPVFMFMAMLIIALTIVIAVVVVTVILVFEMVRRLRVSGIIAASWGKRRKTTSQPIAIPLLMTMLIVPLTVVIAVVVVTVILVFEMVRGSRVSGIIAASRGKQGKTTSEPVTIPPLDGIDGRGGDKSH